MYIDWYVLFNLVVAGLVEDLQDTHPDLQSIGMFDITPVALIVVALGSIVFVMLTLPPRSIENHLFQQAMTPKNTRWVTYLRRV